MEEKTHDDSAFTKARLGSSPSDLFQEVITRPDILPLMKPERFNAELTVDLAHTVMLTECGIISPTDGLSICSALTRAMERGPNSIQLDTSKDSSLFQIETYLAKEIGSESAGRMHTGRSRTDRGAAIMRLQLRNHLNLVVSALLDWQKALVTKGEEFYDTVLPGYTHLQSAQPITLGHHLLAQFWLHVDDVERLQLAYKHTNTNPMGTASIAGTSWPIDRDRTRSLLGFDTSTENARVSRTYIFRAEIANVYSTLLATLHYLASDLYIWFSEEFGMVEPDDRHSGSSSIMPQKKNPYVWEKTRVMARHASGWPASALSALMGASSSDSFLDSPEIESYGPVVEGLLKVNTETLQLLRVNKGRMLYLAQQGFSTANHLADILVREKSLPFRQAHAVVGRFVRLCLDQGKRPSDLNSALLNEAAEDFGVQSPDIPNSRLIEILDPVSFVHSRKTLGSTNPVDVKRQIKAASELLDSHKTLFLNANESIRNAETEMKRSVARILSSET